MIKKIIFGTIIPLGLMACWYFAIRPVCMEAGVVDWKLLWLLGGIPFGLRFMFVRLSPKDFGFSGGLGVIALNFLLAGLIGGFVVLYKAVKAVVNLPIAILGN